MSFVASLKIVAENGTAAVFGKIRTDAKKMGDAFKPVASEARAMTGAIDRIGGGTAAKFAAIRVAARRMAEGGFKVAEKAAYGAGYGIGFVAKKALGVAATFAKIAAGAGVAAVAAAGFSAFSRAAKLDELSAELEAIEKSSIKAKYGFSWVREFAQTSTIPMLELQQAFVAARKAGIEPTAASFGAFQDAAKGAKRDIADVINTVSGSKIGDFGGLESLGIFSKVSDKAGITFTYLDKQGNRLRQNIKNDAKAIEKSLTQIFTAKYGGSNNQAAKSFLGIWSQIKNTYSGFEQDVADAGIFDLIKTKANALLVTAQGFAKDGSLKSWAKEVSQGLESAVNWASSFTREDWKQAGSDVKDIAQAMWSLARATASFVGFASKVIGIPKGIGDWAKGIDGGVVGFFDRNGMKPIGSAYDWVNGGNNRPPPSSAGSPRRTGPLIKPLAGPNPWRLPSGGATPRQAPVKVGGALDIRIRTDPGTTATATRLSSNNNDVPITLASRGKVSFG